MAKNRITTILLPVLFLFSQFVHGEIVFEDVTVSAGINHSGRTFGASWGDYDNDGWPDLWVGNHGGATGHPSLYHNSHNNTFQDIAGPPVWSGDGRTDTHGAAWADFDNDDDNDLLELVGAQGGTGQGSNNLYIGENGQLLEKASMFGLTYPSGRGRTPLWLDWNNDGLLDVFATNGIRTGTSSVLFLQNKSGFTIDTLFSAQFDRNEIFALLGDLTNDGVPELIVHGTPFPKGIYQLGSGVDISSAIGLPKISQVQDAIVADFNGDMQNDIFLARANVNASDAIIVSNNVLRARLLTKAIEKGIDIITSGNINFTVDPPYEVKNTDIYIGASGYNPASSSFTLDSADNINTGMPAYQAGVSKGLFIGYIDGSWRIRVSSSNRFDVKIEAISENTINNMTTVGFIAGERSIADRLLLRSTSGFNITPLGSNQATSCQSAAAGDFDNDMDLDIYMVCTGSVNNQPNILYENLGNGTFVITPLAGGAQGSNLGRGDSVAIADYDQDGHLDLFLTNGDGSSLFADNGPHQLFRNASTTNHWIEIDLEGVISNRDGIGAQVLVTAAGKTQLREQNGGMHRFSQNHSRIHFGLGNNIRAEKIIVKWPSGIVQELTNIAADQIIQIIEPVNPVLKDKPVYLAGIDKGVYLWKETIDGPYHLRLSGDGTTSTYKIKLVSSAEVKNVNWIGPIPGTALKEVSESGFSLLVDVHDEDIGVDFSLRPGAKALVSAELNGVANPRQLHIGASSQAASPAGWIQGLNELTSRPPFTPGLDLGLFIGKNTFGEIEARMNGDGKLHTASIHLLTSSHINSVTKRNIEGNDLLTTQTSGVQLDGRFRSWWDGFDVDIDMTAGIPNIGLVPTLDKLLQTHRINPDNNAFNHPNAYWLPLIDITAKPAYKPGTEAGLFLWKDLNNIWHLRVTAGGGFIVYTGTVTSDLGLTLNSTVSIESSDIITTDNSQISFTLKTYNKGYDGFDFTYPPGSSVNLVLSDPSGTKVTLVKIGAEKWPITQFPLSLSSM